MATVRGAMRTDAQVRRARAAADPARCAVAVVRWRRNMQVQLVRGLATFEITSDGVRVLATHGPTYEELADLLDVPLVDGRDVRDRTDR